MFLLECISSVHFTSLNIAARIQTGDPKVLLMCSSTVSYIPNDPSDEEQLNILCEILTLKVIQNLKIWKKKKKRSPPHLPNHCYLYHHNDTEQWQMNKWRRESRVHSIVIDARSAENDGRVVQTRRADPPRMHVEYRRREQVPVSRQESVFLTW